MRGGAVVEAVAKHTATLIFLHGLGDTGSGWAQALQTLQRRQPGLRIVCPHASSRPVTLNGGMDMPAWYDIASLGGPTPNGDTGRTQDWDGLEESRRAVLRLVAQEAARVPLGRIFLGGFSQGAAVSLFTLLREYATDDAPSDAPDATQLGGVVALSGYVPCHERLMRAGAFPGTEGRRVPRVFVAHGTADAVVQLRWHTLSVGWLTEMLGSAPLAVRTYDGMGHASCAKELSDVSSFLLEGGEHSDL
jgi:lysophospholipase-2